MLVLSGFKFVFSDMLYTQEKKTTVKGTSVSFQLSEDTFPAVVRVS